MRGMKTRLFFLQSLLNRPQKFKNGMDFYRNSVDC